MLADILLRSVKQQSYLLLRKPNIIIVKADIDISYAVIILIEDKLTV